MSDPDRPPAEAAFRFVGAAGAGVQLAGDLRNAHVPFTVFTVDRHFLGLGALVPALTNQADVYLVSQILAFR